MWRVYFIFWQYFCLYLFIYLFVVEGEIRFSLSFSLFFAWILPPFHSGICYSHLAETTKTPSGKGDKEAEFPINFKTLLLIKLRDRQAERKQNNKTLDAKIKKSKHSPLHRGGVDRQTLSYSLPHLKYSLTWLLCGVGCKEQHLMQVNEGKTHTGKLQQALLRPQQLPQPLSLTVNITSIAATIRTKMWKAWTAFIMMQINAKIYIFLRL